MSDLIRDYLLKQDALVQEWMKKLEDATLPTDEDGKPRPSYLPTDRSGEVVNKVVRVAILMKTLHFMAAHMCFKVLPENWKSKLAEFVLEPMVKFLVGKLFKMAGKGVPSPKGLIDLVKIAEVVAVQGQIERDLEKHVRDALAPIRAQLQAYVLVQGVLQRVKKIRSRNADT